VGIFNIPEETLIDVSVTEHTPQEGVDQQVVSNVHSSARIQHDLELWRRAREYDKRAAAESLPPALTRQQKLHIKKTTSGKPQTTRSTGNKSTSH
jgi:hypothetical protein